jgi:hypothetical protein
VGAHSPRIALNGNEPRGISQSGLGLVEGKAYVGYVWISASEGAGPVQVYWQGIYHFAPDEALILETTLPNKVRYWNVQLNDVLWNAVEFVQRQGSLNGFQARVDQDGKFRAVISLTDPGVPNWLDPAGNTQGMLIGRWYAADSHPLPTLRRVPLARVRDNLPADTPTMTTEQRAEQLRRRRIGGQLRRRW